MQVVAVLILVVLQSSPQSCVESWSRFLSDRCRQFSVSVSIDESDGKSFNKNDLSWVTRGLVERDGDRWHSSYKREARKEQFAFSVEMSAIDDQVLNCYRMFSDSGDLKKLTVSGEIDRTITDNYLISESLWDVRYAIGLYSLSSMECVPDLMLKSPDLNYKRSGSQTTVTASNEKDRFLLVFEDSMTIPTRMEYDYTRKIGEKLFVRYETVIHEIIWENDLSLPTSLTVLEKTSSGGKVSYRSSKAELKKTNPVSLLGKKLRIDWDIPNGKSVDSKRTPFDCEYQSGRIVPVKPKGSSLNFVGGGVKIWSFALGILFLVATYFLIRRRNR